MVDLKNWRAGLKIEEERGKKEEEKRNGYRWQTGELIYIYARVVFSWRTCQDASKTTLKR